jgi:hypothetical protein
MNGGSKLAAKWLTLYFDSKVDARGSWIKVTETRPSGHRQSTLLEQSMVAYLPRELQKAVSENGHAPTIAHLEFAE